MSRLNVRTTGRRYVGRWVLGAICLACAATFGCGQNQRGRLAGQAAKSDDSHTPLDARQVERLRAKLQIPHAIDAEKGSILLTAIERPAGHVYFVDPFSRALVSVPINHAFDGQESILLSNGVRLSLAHDWRETSRLTMSARWFNQLDADLPRSAPSPRSPAQASTATAATRSTTSVPAATEPAVQESSAATSTATPAPNSALTAPRPTPTPPTATAASSAPAPDEPKRPPLSTAARLSAERSSPDAKTGPAMPEFSQMPAAVLDEEITLPGPVVQATPGGNGRWLLLSMPSLRMVALFDFRTSSIAGYLDVGTRDFYVAAGATRFVILNGELRETSRYRYEDLEEEHRAAWPVPDDFIVQATMGMESEGPLYVLARRNLADSSTSVFRMIDLKTLKLAAVRTAPVRVGFGDESISTSSDGRTLFVGRSVRPLAKEIYRWLDNAFVPQPFDLAHKLGTRAPSNQSDDAAPQLSPAGDWLHYAGARRKPDRTHVEPLLNGAGIVACGSLGQEAWCAVSTFGSGEGAVAVVAIQVGEERRHVAAMKFVVQDGRFQRDFREIMSDNSSNRSSLLWQSQRQIVTYSPQEKKIVLVASTPGRLLVKNFDLDEAIANAEFDLLTVVSAPPVWYTPGKPYRYQIEARSKHAPVDFELVSGPEGMTVSKTGLIQWKPILERAPAGSPPGGRPPVVHITVGPSTVAAPAADNRAVVRLSDPRGNQTEYEFELVPLPSGAAAAPRAGNRR